MIVVVLIGATMAIIGLLGLLLSQGTIGPRLTFSSPSVVIDDCPTFVVPTTNVDVSLPSLLYLLLQDPVKYVTVEGSAEWGLTDELIVPDVLLGRTYCSISGPPWSVSRIDAGDYPQDVAFSWGSATAGESLQLPSSPVWVVGTSSEDSVSIGWTMTYEWQRDLFFPSLVISLVGCALLITITVVVWRKRRVRADG